LLGTIIKWVLFGFLVLLLINGIMRWFKKTGLTTMGRFE